MSPSRNTQLRPAIAAGALGLSLVLASCSTSTPEASSTGSAASPASSAQTSSPAPSPSKSTDESAPELVEIGGLKWKDGSAVVASKVSFKNAEKPQDNEVHNRAAHELPAGEEFIGILEEGLPIVLQDSLPYTVDSAGRYSLYWPEEQRSAAKDATSWQIQEGTLLALTSNGSDSETGTLLTYNPTDGLNKVDGVDTVGLGTAGFVVDSGKVYWTQLGEKTNQVFSASLADGKKKLEAKEAAAVYRTDQGVAVLKREDNLPTEKMNQISGVELLDGTALLAASDGFEVGGFSGDGIASLPQMDGGPAISFSINLAANKIGVVVLNLQAQKAWIVELDEGRIPFGISTSGPRSFIAWSEADMEELGALGNEAVVLDAGTGKLSAFTPKNNFESIFANGNALGWSTKSSSGSVSFASEILK